MSNKGRGEIRCLSATGQLGSGFRESSLRAGLALDPHFVGCDAGSIDFGPYYLGSGERHFGDEAVRRDVHLILEAAFPARIPVVFGSAGTSGIDAQVHHLRTLVGSLARATDRRIRVAAVYCEPPRGVLVDRLRQGTLHALDGGRPLPLDETTLERCSHIVAMAGVEPLIEALDAGADVVVAGRTSDAAIFAALPILRGASARLAWHAGKLLECGAACVVQRRYPDCLFAWIGSDSFTVVPPNPEFRCSPVSVAAHNLYESSSPYQIREPSGMLDTSACSYALALEDERAVTVTGSAFEPAREYSVKLEGAERAGYQSLFFGAIRDPVLVRELDPWLASLERRLRMRFEELAGDGRDGGWALHFRRYGVDAAMGDCEPSAVAHHEVGLVVEVTSDDPERAHALANVASHIALHHPTESWTGLITTMAVPYSPAVLDRGPVYRFALNHVVRPADPAELFSIEYEDIV